MIRTEAILCSVKCELLFNAEYCKVCLKSVYGNNVVFVRPLGEC